MRASNPAQSRPHSPGCHSSASLRNDLLNAIGTRAHVAPRSTPPWRSRSRTPSALLPRHLNTFLISLCLCLSTSLSLSHTHTHAHTHTHTLTAQHRGRHQHSGQAARGSQCVVRAQLLTHTRLNPPALDLYNITLLLKRPFKKRSSVQSHAHAHARTHAHIPTHFTPTGSFIS